MFIKNNSGFQTMLEYPLWLLIFVILPTIVMWIWKFDHLKKYWIVFVLAPIGSLIFSIPWDIISVRENIWYFKEPYIWGLWIMNLPIEEWLFIILVTLMISTLAVLVWKRYGVEK